MGVLADAVLDAGGEVLGVITRALVDREVAHPGLTNLVSTRPCMSARPRCPTRPTRSSCCPAATGPSTSSSRSVTWTQLGIHAKPCGVLDVDGYFEPLRALLDGAVRQGFVTRPTGSW